MAHGAGGEAPGGLDAELYAGLQALAAQAFPKRCPSCGRTFASADDYVLQTGRVGTGGSGLKQAMDDDGRVIVELFRNCVCGSTLMDSFADRRDDSAAGRQRRMRFGELLAKLIGKGLAPARARREMLKVLNGEPSDILRVVPRGQSAPPSAPNNKDQD